MHFRTKHIFVLLKVGQLESILKSRSCVMQTMTRCDRYRQGHLQGHLYPWIQNRRCANILFSCLEKHWNCFLKYKLSFCCVSFVIHFAVVFALVFMTEARVFETFRAFPVTLNCPKAANVKKQDWKWIRAHLETLTLGNPAAFYDSRETLILSWVKS